MDLEGSSAYPRREGAVCDNQGRCIHRRDIYDGLMGSRNVDVLGYVVEAANARTEPVELLAPGFQMEHRASAVTDRTYRGANGWREWVDDLFEVFATGA